MNVLDELYARVVHAALSHATLSTEEAFVAVFSLLLDFERTHPGLFDYTVPCAVCGQPMDGYAARCWGFRPVCSACREAGAAE